MWKQTVWITYSAIQRRCISFGCNGRPHLTKKKQHMLSAPLQSHSAVLSEFFHHCRRREASGKPRTEHVPKRVSSFRRSESPSSLQDVDASDFGGSSGSYTFNHAPPPSYKQAGMHEAHCMAWPASFLPLHLTALLIIFFTFYHQSFLSDSYWQSSLFLNSQIIWKTFLKVKKEHHLLIIILFVVKYPMWKR